MNKNDWNVRFQEAIQLGENDPERAADLAVELADEAKRALKDSIGELDEKEALQMAGMLLADAGNLDRAEELYQQALEICRLQMLSWSKATTFMLTIIAFLQFRQGRPDEAMKTGHEALRSLGHDPNPRADGVLGDLMKEMTEQYTKRVASEHPEVGKESSDG